MEDVIYTVDRLMLERKTDLMFEGPFPGAGKVATPRPSL